jgi:hypothetical protein
MELGMIAEKKADLQAVRGIRETKRPTLRS